MNVKAHFTSAEAKSFTRLYFNVVRSRSEPKVAYLTDGVVAFADDNVSITFTPSLEALAERIAPAVTASFLPGAQILTVFGDISRVIEQSA